LRELHARGNGLTSLPGTLGDLTELRVLDFRDNALTTLPDTLGALPNLRSLDLRANPLHALSETLPPSLERLDLRWTPFYPELPPAAQAVRDRGGVVWA
jgi:Leucine-rich repeat (LRR) protein